jgi:hypothetical protein
MKKAVWSGVIAAGMVFLAADAYAQGQTDTKSVNVSVAVNARAKLEITASNISFTDQDPDSVATLNSSSFDVDVKARTSATGTVELTVKAFDVFKNAAGDTIDLSTLGWAGSGDAGFAASGISDNITAQSVGTFTGSGHRQASYAYSLPNLWAYAVGNYSVRLDYTLTAP